MTKREALLEAYDALRGHYPAHLTFHWKGYKLTRKDFAYAAAIV